MPAVRPCGPARWMLLVASAACGDGPAGPEDRIPRGIEALAGDGQEAEAGQGLAVAPAVVVRNGNGDGVAGVTVRFEVVQGGGSIEGASAVTDSRGVARAGRWTLGPRPGEQVLQAEAETLPPVRFVANATSPFHIELVFIGNATSRQRQAVERAADRWRNVVIADLPDVPVSLRANMCLQGQPALSRVVDDIVVFIGFVSIDGAGKVLGRAGPCVIRNGIDLPIAGLLNLDSDDLVQIEQIGLLDDLVLHELGHVLGFGTLWSARDLVSGAGGSDPRFTGENAIDAYRDLGGSRSSVPVENAGQEGTRDAHWRESTFNDELMTGFLSARANPLSAVTTQSLRDLGYAVDAAASDAFVLAPGAARPVLDLHGRETVVPPILRVERDGLLRPTAGIDPTRP